MFAAAGAALALFATVPRPARAADPTSAASNPAAPSASTHVEVVGAIGGRLTDVQLEGNLAYVARGSNLEIEDVTDPENPKLLGRVHLPGVIDSFGQFRGAVYAAVFNRGLFLIDAMDPTNPKRRGRIGGEPHTIRVEVIGDRMIIGDGYKRIMNLHYYDISDPLNPRFLEDKVGDELPDIQPAHTTGKRSCSGPGNPQSIFISGSFALIADGSRGLAILDITDPPNPRARGSIPLAGDSEFVTARGGLAYVTQRAGSDPVGIHVVDISNPDAPRLIHTEEGFSGKLVLRQNLGYMLVPESGIHIFDLADPATPKDLLVYEAAALCSDIEIFGDSAVLAGNGLQILSLIDPWRPAPLATIPVRFPDADSNEETPSGITTRVLSGWGNRVLTGPGNCHHGDAALLDLADPKHPVPIREFVDGGLKVQLSADWACFTHCDETSSTADYDLTFESLSKDHARRLPYEDINSPAQVTPVGDLFYVADGEGGVIILRPPKQ